MERSPIGPGPLIYAHRGDRSRAADNTLEAYALAVEAGADGIELDVRRTKDGTLIMSHDDRVGELPPIIEMTFDEIRAQRPAVPTFKEMLAAVPSNILLNVEIKNWSFEHGFDEARDTVAAVIAAINQVDDPQRILLSSFDALSVQRAQDELPNLLRGQLVLKEVALDDAIALAVNLGVEALHPPIETFRGDAEFVTKHIQAHSLAAIAWNVNEADDIAALFRAGVDGLITDDPGMAREILSEV